MGSAELEQKAMTRFFRSPYFPLAVQAVIAAATVTQLVLAMNGVVS